jgi:hypothetical protein
VARIAFHIERINYFKVLGGVIDEAMRRGHETVLLYDAADAGKMVKGLPLPSSEHVPKFIFGTPRLLPYGDGKSFANIVRAYADILVLHQGFFGTLEDYRLKVAAEDSIFFQYQHLRCKGVPVVSVASHFFDTCLWPIEAFDFFDKVCVLSRYAVQKHKDILLELYEGPLEDRNKYAISIDAVYANKAVITGSALFDMFIPLYTGRNKAKQSAVLFAPKIDDHPFMQVMMREHSRCLAAILSLLKYQGRYFWNIFTEPRFAEFVRGLVALCTSLHLRLVVKSRPKHGVMHDGLYARHADEYITGGGDVFYPDFTSVEIFKDAACSFHMRTFSVMEAVIAGTYAINFDIPIADKRDHFDGRICAYVKAVRTPIPGSLFNFEGCVRNVSWKDAPRFLREQSGHVPAIDPERRRQYMADFCGIDDEKVSSSKRIVDVLDLVLRIR